MGMQVSSVELRDAVERFNTELEQALRKHHAAVEDFVRDYHRWLQKRMAVIDALSSFQTTIDEHHHNVNIASITGSSVSLVSGAACLAGLALAPFTGGVSVALTAGGLLGTTAGSLTTVGARLVDFGLSKGSLKRALELVEEDCQETMHLSLLIESCAKHQTEVQNLAMNPDLLSVIKRNEDVFIALLTTPLLKEKYQRIKKGTATPDDFLIIINLLCSGNLHFLEKVHSAGKVILVEPKLIEGTIRAATCLRSAVGNVRKCSVLLKNWRMGLSGLKVAGKASRLAKGAMLGLSMVVDAYEIGSTAKEMVLGQRSYESRYLHTLIEELQHQVQDISSYYDSLNV